MRKREKKKKCWKFIGWPQSGNKTPKQQTDHGLDFVSGAYGLNPEPVSHNSAQTCSRYCYKAEPSINPLLKHQSFTFKTAY